MRKIKCHTSLGQRICNSCIKHSRECTYQARTRYYAERERAIVASMTRGGTIGFVATTNTMASESIEPSVITLM
jgi:hypothetical protein